MKKHLIALDLDGTLLYDWLTLDEGTRDYLNKLKEKGHHLVIATGRPYRSSIRFYEQLELDTPLINYNGGLITRPGDPAFDEVNILVNRDAVVDIFKNNKEHIDNAFCEIKDDIYLFKESEDIVELLHFFNGATMKIGAFDETLPGGTNGFIIVAKENQGQFIEEYVTKHYPGELMTRNWGSEYRFIIELYTPKTNKGRALRYVADYLGVEQDHIIAFGDGNNDLEMLEFAGTGVAMNNAREELKEVADVVSPHTNQERAIENFLDEYFNKKAESD